MTNEEIKKYFEEATIDDSHGPEAGLKAEEVVKAVLKIIEENTELKYKIDDARINLDATYGQHSDLRKLCIEYKAEIEKLKAEIEVHENIIKEMEKYYEKQSVKNQENDGWIDVNDRLPEEGQYVLCCLNDKAIINPSNIVITQKFKSELDYWKNGIILAWQPLPQPYEIGKVE